MSNENTPESWPCVGDYAEAVNKPGYCFSGALQRAEVVKNLSGQPIAFIGRFGVVFKLLVGSGRALALRCFLRPSTERDCMYEEIGIYLRQLPADNLLANFYYNPRGILVSGRSYPTLQMEWIKGKTLDRYLERALNAPDELHRLASSWLEATGKLQEWGIAHGDLQHGNILVSRKGLRLVDFDDMYVPSMRNRRGGEIGHKNYQHPERDDSFFNENTDNFSTLVIYASLISLAADPSLWSRYHNSANLIFSENDFKDPGNSPLFAELTSLWAPSSQVAEFARILQSACMDSINKCPTLEQIEKENPGLFTPQPLRLSALDPVSNSTQHSPSASQVLSATAAKSSPETAESVESTAGSQSNKLSAATANMASPSFIPNSNSAPNRVAPAQPVENQVPTHSICNAAEPARAEEHLTLAPAESSISDLQDSAHLSVEPEAPPKVVPPTDVASETDRTITRDVLEEPPKGYMLPGMLVQRPSTGNKGEAIKLNVFNVCARSRNCFFCGGAQSHRFETSGRNRIYASVCRWSIVSVMVSLLSLLALQFLISSWSDVVIHCLLDIGLAVVFFAELGIANLTFLWLVKPVLRLRRYLGFRWDHPGLVLGSSLLALEFIAVLKIQCGLWDCFLWWVRTNSSELDYALQHPTSSLSLSYMSPGVTIASLLAAFSYILLIVVLRVLFEARLSINSCVNCLGWRQELRIEDFLPLKRVVYLSCAAKDKQMELEKRLSAISE